MRWWWLGCSAFTLGCGPCGALDGLAPADGLYLGDSLLAWNDRSCRSIPANTALVRGVGYESAAVNGAQLLSAEAPIGDQRAPEAWPLVVINGGANDLNGFCDCGDCGSVLDQLASEDGARGAMSRLVDAWRDAGAQVVLLGYYPVPNGAWYGFDKCVDAISALDARYAAVAARRDGVTFFDLGDVMAPETGGYGVDRAHPSPRGAARLGQALAEVLDALPGQDGE